MPEVAPEVDEFQQLMAELATGSEDAAWRIAEVYTPHILKAVRAALPAIIRPKLDSQDFAQAVWASLLMKRTYLARVTTHQQLVGLLAAAARHKVIDAYRHYTATAAYNVRSEESIDTREPSSRRGGASGRGLLGRDPSPSQMASLREQWRLTVERSSLRDRQILALRMKGQTYGQISQTLGVSVATVRRVLDRLIDELRK